MRSRLDTEENVRMAEEMRIHLQEKIIPFWQGLKDKENGGYYGCVSFDLVTDKDAEKGGILISRILWFFSMAAVSLKDSALLEDARHAYEFLRDNCLDRKYGGIYWSVTAQGEPQDTTKHTYGQAFGIYALSAYHEASGDPQALELAVGLYDMVENRCRDDKGYLEAFSREFENVPNEKLSGRGVIAYRTMNTLLHVFEAYTQLYKVWTMEQLKKRIMWILDIFIEKVYNPKLRRQEVFFDSEYRSLADIQSYGHDIETSWLLEEGTCILGDKEYEKRIRPITQALAGQVYKMAFDGRSIANECGMGITDRHRIWWVQAEGVVGFLSACEKDPKRQDYSQAAGKVWAFIKSYMIDGRTGSEWFWEVSPEGAAYEGRPIVEPWKCPYHNGRMCMEVIRRVCGNA